MTMNSDMCIGGETQNPEGVFKAMVEIQKVDGVELEATNYYVIDSCVGRFSAIKELEDLVAQLQEGATLVNDLNDLLQGDADRNTAAICNNTPERMEEIIDAVGSVSDAFVELDGLANEVLGIMQCGPVNDVYVDLHHDLLCTTLPYTMAWTFATMVCVFVFGMIIFLIRGALLPPERTSGMYENVHSEEHFDRSNRNNRSSNDDMDDSDEQYRDSSRSRILKDDDISYGFDQNDGSDEISYDQSRNSHVDQSRNSHAYDLSGDGDGVGVEVNQRGSVYDPDRN